MRTDIAIRRAENTSDRDFFVRGWVEDLGDLQESMGYDEVDGSDLHLVSGKTAPQTINSLSDLTEDQAFDLLKQGYLAIRLQSGIAGEQLHQLPIQIFRQAQFYPTSRIDLGGTANFYIADSSNKLRYAVLNGYLIDLSKPLTQNFKNRVL